MDSLEAGLRFSRAAYKSRIVIDAIIIDHITEREAVAEHQRLNLCFCNSISILLIKLLQLFSISVKILLICIGIVLVFVSYSLLDRLTELDCILERQPHVLVILNLFSILMMMAVLVIFVFVAVMVVMVMLFLFRLHSFLDLLCLLAVLHLIHQVDSYEIFVSLLLKYIADPLI